MRNYNLIAGLAERHTIDLLTFGDATITAPPLSALCRRVRTLPAPARSMARRALTTLASPWPDMALRLWSPAFAGSLEEWLRDDEYEVIQVEGIEMARYGLLARRPGLRARLVFDDHNAEWLLQKRTYDAERQLNGWNLGAVYSLIQTWKLRRFERAACPGFASPRRADRRGPAAFPARRRRAALLRFYRPRVHRNDGLSPQRRRCVVVRRARAAPGARGDAGGPARRGRAATARAPGCAARTRRRAHYRRGSRRATVYRRRVCLRRAAAHGRWHAVEGARSHGDGRADRQHVDGCGWLRSAERARGRDRR